MFGEGVLRWKSLTAFILGIAVASLVALRAQPKGTKAPTLTALDYIEIEQLNARYAHALDTCADKGNEFARLFTSDGVFSANDNKYPGPEGLAKAAGGPDCAAPKNPLNVQHIALENVIEPSPGGATGKSYLLQVSFGEDGKGGQVLGGGRYYDVYVKTSEGWRFKSRAYVRTPRVDLIPPSERSRTLSH